MYKFEKEMKWDAERKTWYLPTTASTEAKKEYAEVAATMQSQNDIKTSAAQTKKWRSYFHTN